MKSLLYYFVLLPSNTDPLLTEVLNVYWRGLCVKNSLRPDQFCQPPNPLTFTQATLVAPLAILFVPFVPTILYVLILSFCKAKKGMGVLDHAILFIFPIFTSFYYNFKSEVKAEKVPKILALEWRAHARSHSSPNISGLATHQGSYRRKLFFKKIFRHSKSISLK